MSKQASQARHLEELGGTSLAHSLACLARNLKPAYRGARRQGEGWHRPEASDLAQARQVQATAKLAQQKSKYLSLSTLISPPLCLGL